MEWIEKMKFRLGPVDKDKDMHRHKQHKGYFIEPSRSDPILPSNRVDDLPYLTTMILYIVGWCHYRFLLILPLKLLPPLLLSGKEGLDRANSPRKKDLQNFFGFWWLGDLAMIFSDHKIGMAIGLCSFLLAHLCPEMASNGHPEAIDDQSS